MGTATYNAALESAGAASGDVGDRPSHIAIWDDVNRTTFKASFALDSTLAALAEGQPIEFSSGDLVLTLTLGGSSSDRVGASGLTDCLRGIFASNVYLSWHTGNPGTAGTANRITGIANTLMVVSNIAYAD